MHEILVTTSAKYAPKIILLNRKKRDTLDYVLQITKSISFH